MLHSSICALLYGECVHESRSKGLIISQELQQIPGSVGSPTTDIKPRFPIAHPPSLLIINTLMDANVQDKAQTLLDSQLTARISKGKQMGMQKSSAKHTVLCNIAVPICPING